MTDKKEMSQRAKARTGAAVERAGRKRDDCGLLLAVAAAAAMAWATGPEQRNWIMEAGRQMALDQRLCRALVELSTPETYPEAPVCGWRSDATRGRPANRPGKASSLGHAALAWQDVGIPLPTIGSKQDRIRLADRALAP